MITEITNLSILSDVVTQADETGLEFFGLQSTSPVLVKVVERQTELIHLIFADTLRVTSQDLKKTVMFETIFMDITLAS